MTPTAPLPALWLSDPAWLSMDATARGFHVQLLLVAARQKQPGVLPMNETLWRKWLGLPPKAADLKTTSLSKAWEKASQTSQVAQVLLGSANQWVEEGQNPACLDPDGLLLWLWEQRWKPMVLNAWQLIDEACVEEYPFLKKSIGSLFSPISHQLGTGNPGVRLEPVVLPNTTHKKAKPAATPVRAWNTHLDIEGEMANEGLKWGVVESSFLHNPQAVLSKWRPAAGEQSQKTIWEVGVGCLTGNNATPSEQGKARAILGKAVKQYGEEAVAKAVATMAMRSIAPVDAVSFLQGILRQGDEGTVAQQTARQKRAALCL